MKTFILMLVLMLSGNAWASFGNPVISDTYAQAVNSAESYIDHIRAGKDAQEHGNWIWAIEEYTRAIEINPKNVSAYQWRAAAYLAAESYYRAWKDVDMIVSLGGKPDPRVVAMLSMAAPRIHGVVQAPVYVEEPQEITNEENDS